MIPVLSPVSERVVAHINTQEKIQLEQKTRIANNRNLVSALTKLRKDQRNDQIRIALGETFPGVLIPVIVAYDEDEDTRDIKIVGGSRNSQFAVLTDKKTVTIAKIEPFDAMYKRRRIAAAATAITGAGIGLGYLLKSRG